jgi:hypothetical protein
MPKSEYNTSIEVKSLKIKMEALVYDSLLSNKKCKLKKYL